MRGQQPSAFDQALSLLSYREHGAQELARKLRIRDYEESDISNVINRLQEMNYLNDERFAEIFVRSKASKPLGANRILQELIQKGINNDLAKQTVNIADVDWFELARQLKERRFGEEQATDYKEKGRQSRYLQYRGFNFDQIKYALSPKDEF